MGRVIEGLKAAGQADRYVYGGEESHGYSSGTHCLDKDAANAGCVMASVVAEQSPPGKDGLPANCWSSYRGSGLYVQGLVNLSLTPAREGGLARAAPNLRPSSAPTPPKTLARPPGAPAWWTTTSGSKTTAGH